MEHNLPVKENIWVMALVTWQLLKVCLWPDTPGLGAFSRKSKSLIRRYLLNRPEPYSSYLELTGNILLARKYYREHPRARWPKTPVEWLRDREFSYIISIGYKLPENNITVSPAYLQRCRNLADALLEMAEEPTASHFNYWSDWFRNRGAVEHLVIFWVCASFNQFKKESL